MKFFSKILFKIMQVLLKISATHKFGKYNKTKQQLILLSWKSTEIISCARIRLPIMLCTSCHMSIIPPRILRDCPLAPGRRAL